MNKSVVGVFPSFADAQLAVQELLAEGVSRSDISIVANAESTNLDERAKDLKRLSLPGGGEVMASGRFGDAMTSTASETELAKWGISAEISSAYHKSIRGGHVLVAVQVQDERVDRVSALMNRYCSSDLKQDLDGKDQLEVTLPIVQEELQVGKREVQRGGVHVVTHVTETPVTESVRLREEHVTVERHAVDRPVTAADTTAFKEGTFEVRQHAEVAVVSKEARVVEEVVIGKKVSEHTETVHDTVRRTDVVVEELTDKKSSLLSKQE